MLHDAMQSPENSLNGKNIPQVIDFLVNVHKSVYAGDLDRQLILSLIPNIPQELFQKPYGIDDVDGLSVEKFTEWLKSGIGVGEIVKFRPKDAPDAPFQLGLTGYSNDKAQKSPVIALKFSDDQLIHCNEETRNLEVLRASEEDSENFHHLLLKNGWRFDWGRMGLVRNHVPEIDDVVRFTDGNDLGVGIVRGITKAEDNCTSVDLHCYLLFKNRNTRRPPYEIGYEYPGKRTFSTSEWIFETLPKIPGSDTEADDERELGVSGKSIPLSHHRSVVRKINQELSGLGKVWNGYQHRVEPVELAFTPNQMRKLRWYVDSKMEVKSFTENNSPVSKARRYVGNSFATEKEARRYREFLMDSLKGYLSQPNPDYPKETEKG